MKQMLLDLVRGLVEHPEEVSVTERVNGREGRIARSIRTVMRAQAVRENKRVIVDIL